MSSPTMIRMLGLAAPWVPNVPATKLRATEAQRVAKRTRGCPLYIIIGSGSARRLCSRPIPLSSRGSLMVDSMPGKQNQATQEEIRRSREASPIFSRGTLSRHGRAVGTTFERYRKTGVSVEMRLSIRWDEQPEPKKLETRKNSISSPHLLASRQRKYGFQAVDHVLCDIGNVQDPLTLVLQKEFLGCLI